MNVVKGVLGINDAPPPPDYTGAARATAQGNLEAAKYATVANRANQNTPYGSLTWQRGATDYDPWTQTINLNETGQQLLNTENASKLGLSGLQAQATDRVRAQQNAGWNDSALNKAGQAYDPNRDTNTATEAILRRVNPQLERRRAAIEAQLANQGITRGSEAWNNAQNDLGQAENDAYSQAGMQGIDLGMRQQGASFGQNNALRSTGFQEQNYFANRDLNQLNALRTGSQVTNPTFGNYTQQQTTTGPDMLSAANMGYQGQVAANNANNANTFGILKGASGFFTG